MKPLHRSVLLLCLLLSLPAVARAQDALPGESLYQLRMSLQDSQGRSFELSTLRGRPVLLAFFYSRCTNVCPMLVNQLQQLDRQMSAQSRRSIRVLLVSLDSDRDDAASLQAFARVHHVDGRRWILCSAAPGDIRVLTAAVGVQYRRLADGNFNHSSVITLLDAQGVRQARLDDPTRPDPAFLRQLARIAGAVGRPAAAAAP